jgi:TIR domain-containing protein/pentapeptide repeat protein
MANPVHLQILEQGVEAWNAWREQNEGIRPDLSEIHLHDLSLSEANLSEVNLTRAYLTEISLSRADLSRSDLSGAEFWVANLSEADLTHANLTGTSLRDAFFNEADLTHANLTGASLSRGNLSEASLREASLKEACFRGTDLSGANLSHVFLSETVFVDTNLTKVQGLETCEHFGPSTLDHRTLARSGPLPLAFLRGCGLPDSLINYLPSLLNQPFQFYSCFISYASQDQAFAERLYADLQNKGVRCWYAPEDMKIGDEFRSRIDASIHVHDRLLLILSEHSIKSRWVQKEVETAFEKEGKENRLVLFPIRLDDTVMQIDLGWAADVRRQRHIGDFTQWKEHDAYQKAFARLLRDLKATAQKPDASA